MNSKSHSPLHDLWIRNGLIVEVSRGPLDRDPNRPDVQPRETIDATGLLVTPGFVDVHTHYDGQATWDEMLAPSCWHGVTTIVMGNCGVGFAPVGPATSRR